MTPEEKLIQLRQENTMLLEIIQQQQAMIEHLQKPTGCVYDFPTSSEGRFPDIM